MTTHLMDEADRCDRVAIMDLGKLIACDTPAALKDRIGGDVISIGTPSPLIVKQQLKEKFAIDAELIADRGLRLEKHQGHRFIPELIEALPGLVDAVSVGKPTLEDVFTHFTGRGLVDASAAAA